MTNRKLASIRKVIQITSIEDSDHLELCEVDGWEVVVRKGEFSEGDLAVYFEIDSWIPHDIAPFLSGSKLKTYNGVVGNRLRTIRLRGQLSQGLLMPLSVLLTPEYLLLNYTVEGHDVTSILGIQLWERPVEAGVDGTSKGNFPYLWKKTDQERCQNLRSEINEHLFSQTKFEVTNKLDGSSLSIGMHEGNITVASRNTEIHTGYDSRFVTMFNKLKIHHILPALGEHNLQISGEMIGPKIQGNPHNVTEDQFFVYDIRKKGKFVSSKERRKLVSLLGIKHVPVLHEAITLEQLNVFSISDLLAYADRIGGEGVVFKAIDGSFSFKAISNNYLMKEK